MPVLFEVSYRVRVLLILHQVCTYDVVIESQTMHPQLSSARQYVARQRSAAQCGVVPCPSFCGAVRSFEHTAAVTSSSCSIRYDTDTRFMYVFCVLVFLLFSVDCPLSVPIPPPLRKYRTYCRSERDINKHTAQCMAISSAQAPLGHYYQFAIRTK